MKKIAAIHDLSGYGRASLTVAIPILTHMGFQVCPLPTAILSAHSEYKDFRSLDLTDYMESFISHWKELQLQFDAIYTGYLASVKQMGIVSDFFEHFKNDQNFILVDPVLGDHGELYSSMTPDMVEGMRKLCSQAKVITPNLTEAAFLLGHNPQQEISVETAIQWCKQLSELGPEHVIITSAPGSNAQNVATLAYNRLDHRTWRVLCDYIRLISRHGRSASVDTGCMLNGDSLRKPSTGPHFINMGIKKPPSATLIIPDGMNQEKVPTTSTKPLPYYKYELVETIEN
ncbi:MAG: pyridoxamine kinase [Butyricimonas paravirosa]